MALVLGGNAELKLLLRLGSSIELLVDRDVVRVEDDICGSRVGVSLDDALGALGDAQDVSELEAAEISSRLSKRKRVNQAQSVRDRKYRAILWYTTYLCLKKARTKISECKLETASTASHVHFEADQQIRVGC